MAESALTMKGAGKCVRPGPLPSQQNDLDLTWDQDLDRSFASEKGDDPDLIPDHDLKPGLASSLPPSCPPLPDDCGYRASRFRLCRSASRNGIVIEMLPVLQDGSSQ